MFVRGHSMCTLCVRMRENPKSVNSYMISDLFARLLLPFVLLLLFIFGSGICKKENKMMWQILD